MRKLLLAAGIAGAALIPSLAFAQQSCEPRRDTSAAGIAAVAINALLGNPDTRADCAHVYGYYDTAGVWHANAVNRTSAQGYYDRDGRWVVGAPNGYYDQGRWIDAASSGYFDAQGRWVPASIGGYYDVNGQMIAGAAPGHYDTSGRWIVGPTTGQYDQYGRWMPGQAAGHRDANGVWIADSAPGYYEGGRWRSGPTRGYYDANGRWIAIAPAAGAYGAQVAYQSRPSWSGAPSTFYERTNWLEQRIKTGMQNGTLDRGDGQRALRSLTDLRRQEKGMRHTRGRLSERAEISMQAKLQRLDASLRWSQPERRWN